MATTVQKKPQGLTAKTILAKTTARTKGAARYVVLDLVEPKLLRGGFAALRCRVHSTADPDGVPKKEKPKKYAATVISQEPDKRLHLARLKVSCSCEAHVFYGGEYALWKAGAADLKYGNGEPPVVRNPQLIPWACKHMTKILAQILAKKV